MPIIFRIYLYCVVLALVFIVLVLTKIKAYADEDENSPLKYVYAIFTHALKYFHFMAVFVPVVNMIFAGMALLVIFKLIRHWFVMRWLILGDWVTGKFIKHPARNFKIKYLIIRRLFNPYLKAFQISLTYDQKLWTNIFNVLKKIANEEKERKSECDPEPHTGSGDQETPAEREENQCP